MTKALAGGDVAQRINEAFPDAATRHDLTNVWISPDSLLSVAQFLYETPDLDFSFLTALTAVDYVEEFELVYQLLSMKKNHSAILRTRCYGREEPSVASVTSIWQGADLQERHYALAALLEVPQRGADLLRFAVAAADRPDLQEDCGDAAVGGGAAQCLVDLADRHRADERPSLGDLAYRSL